MMMRLQVMDSTVDPSPFRADNYISATYPESFSIRSYKLPFANVPALRACE